MKDNILVWQDYDFSTFGIVKSLQKKYDCNVFAIIDVADRTKKFFLNQQFIKFTKFWFYHDYILKLKKEPDVKYLRTFEEKYKINLWLLACNDRIFFNYNEFYRYKTDEILLIIEQECKFFEKILDEIKPSFLIIPDTNSRRMHLFYEMCRINGINILMLKATRFAYRCMISNGEEKIDPASYQNHKIVKNRSVDELQDYLKARNASKEAYEYSNQFLKSKTSMLKAVFQFLFISKNTNYKTHHTYYGRTKFRVVTKSLYDLIKKKYRFSFINRNFIRKEDNEPFIFFPLTTEPEKALLIAAPFHTNQLELIKSVVKSMPVGYKLYVKEHHAMNTRSWRPISYYKQIIDLPNVKLIHPFVSAEEILKKCSLVIAIGSTVGLEAAFYGKPTITFVDTIYSHLKSVHVLKNIEEMPKIIQNSLRKEVDVKDLNEFVDFIHENSFEFNWGGFLAESEKTFFYNGFLSDVDISTLQMENFLQKHNSLFDRLAIEYIKKIQKYKKT